MKNLKYIIMASIASLALLTWSCGGGSNSDDEPEPTPTPPATKGKHFTSICNMAARSGSATVTLTGLSAKVSNNSGSASWLTVTLEPYSSGTPKAELQVTENSQKTSRQQDVTFYSAKDTLVLTVKQAAFNVNGETDMTSPFDTPSSQPGYVRRR